MNPEDVNFDEDGWFTWEVSRTSSNRADEDFSWRDIEKVHITALAKPGVNPSSMTIGVGAFKGFADVENAIQQTGSESSTSLGDVDVEVAFPGLSFIEPVDLAISPDNTNRFFVVERRGLIKVFQGDEDTVAAKTFLDISRRVEDSNIEQGLLGLAFDPQYQTNGYFYVYYTASSPRRAIISRFSLSTNDKDSADPEDEQIILSILQPPDKGGHNAGQLRFGPDGYLYISVGEGMVAQNAQNTSNLLGSILRIDVINFDSRVNYSIPPDNPYVNSGTGTRSEIFAYGLRNPWRFGFDERTGDLWVGDVGANNFEEINLIEPGRNYGWPIMEGLGCFQKERAEAREAVVATCEAGGYEPPIVEQHHSQARSIIGGFVYRGDLLPMLKGAYIYADFGTGNMWAFRYDDAKVTEHMRIFDNERKDKIHISTIVPGQSGEIYLLSFTVGKPETGLIYKVKEES